MIVFDLEGSGLRWAWRVNVDRRVIKTIDDLLKDVRVWRVICRLLWETYAHSSSHTLRHSFYYGIYSFWHESLFSLIPCFLRWFLLLPPEDIGCLCLWIFWFSGAFEKLPNATVSSVMSIRLSVRPSAWNNSVPTGRIFMKFYVWVFLETQSTKGVFHNLTKWRLFYVKTFTIISRRILLRMVNVSDKFLEEIRSHIWVQ